MLWASLHTLLLPFLILFLTVAGGILLEQAWPAEANQTPRNTIFNVLYGAMVSWLRLALGPGVGIAVTLALNSFGAGWISLPSHGWAVAFSAVIYIATIDLLEFSFHRLQHTVPFLWEMHSFHHSDAAVNVSTALRNFWMEAPIKMLFVYPVAAMLFSVPPPVLAIYAGTTVWHSVNHLNVRWRSPIPWFVLNNPQFHRLHHSILPEHYNRNFSPYFPVWDLLAGTAYVPKPDEYPPTGLVEQPEPVSFAESLLWPWRHRLRSAALRSVGATG